MQVADQQARHPLQKRSTLHMSNDNVVSLSAPAQVSDPLTDVLRAGARRLIEAAVSAEFEEYLSALVQEKLPDGRQRVARNGYLPERKILTGLGEVDVRVPKAPPCLSRPSPSFGPRPCAAHGSRPCPRESRTRPNSRPDCSCSGGHGTAHRGATPRRGFGCRNRWKTPLHPRRHGACVRHSHHFAKPASA